MKHAYRTYIVVAILIVMNTGFSETKATPRPKRVVPGYDLTSRSAYATVKYYVWISGIPDCTHFHTIYSGFPRITIFDFGLIPCEPRPTNLVCGGALITPKLVATACHCIADFEYRGHRFEGRGPKDWVFWEPHFSPGKVKNHYLNSVEVWAGRSYVATFGTDFTRSKGYYIHPRCAFLNDSPFLNTFDFGWIVLHNPIADDQGDFDITYAPLYRELQLKEFRRTVQSKELVCLIMGYGKTAYDEFDKSYGNVSNLLRYGWVVTMDRISCYWYTTSFYADLVKGKYNHTEICSWACQRPFGLRGGHYGSGDSGSPISCSDEHFALVSSGGMVRFERYIDDFGYHMPSNFYMYAEMISSTPFHYAYEYRRSFIELMEQYEKQMDYIRRHAIQFADLVPPTLPPDIRHSTIGYAALEKVVLTSNTPSLQQFVSPWLAVIVGSLVFVHHLFALRVF